ncbi:MAG: hypothetical protein O3B13_22905 [Planctomycetota bacterium]|nr:hypothetical protein [Planctomycetota bacterium]
MNVHALFDPYSRYRQATEVSIWEDGGQTSVVQFFREQLRQKLREEWMFEVPSEPQDFGYSPETNKALYESMKRRAEAVGATRQQRTPQREMAAPEMSSPALLVFDFADPESVSEPEQHRFPDLGAETFTGFNSKPVREADHFEVDLWLEPYRHTVLLLLSPVRLRHLSEALGIDEPDTLAMIQQALSHESLSSTTRQQRQQSLASRLCDVLRLVPTLEGISNREGNLKLAVDLGCSCPVADPDSWLVACQGPCVAL